MSLPTFKLNPTDSQVNSGFSPDAKLKTSGGIQDIISNAKETASSLEFPSLSSSNGYSEDNETGFFSFTFIIRAILIVVIGWFMWVNLANHGEFNLGVGSLVEKVSDFFKSMEENGRVLYARVTGNIADYKSTTVDADSSKPQDGGENRIAGDTQVKQKRDIKPPSQRSSDGTNRNIPVPPSMTNSAEKKPGFNHEDNKYTFLDKASREYTGPSPSPDDSTSKTQKHQSGKAGYCYIGEDRGFRSCIKVEAGDKCMSGDVFSRQDICMNPSLRE